MNATAAIEIERRSIDADELAIGLRILADLIDAGLPLTRVLQAFAGVAPPRWRDVTPHLLTGVKEGRGLARSMEDSAIVIPPIVLGLVKAGESGSGLPAAMRRAAEHAEASAATQAAVRSAIAYPAMIAVVGSGAIVMMVAVVLPRFSAVLAELQQTLPPLTQLVLTTADMFRRWSGALVGALVLAIIALHQALQRQEGRRVVDRFLLRLPLIGTIRWAGATARFAGSLGAMLECGVALRTGLRHAASAIGDEEIVARLETARGRIDTGEPVGRALDSLGVITPLAARLIAAGEESGRLPGMLAFAARLEHARAERLTRTAVRFIEPSLILVFAVIVGVVATAMLQAIYSVRPT